MDASEQDNDVLIQRYSVDLIADFDRSLGPFLRKPDGGLRRRVRVRDTSRLVEQLLEPFQELPQLLDPHLSKYLPTLAEAYLEYLQHHSRSKSLSTRSNLLEPLPSAICRIIYALCKIRGEKVIVRFLNVETRYLELVLRAIEDSERQENLPAESTTSIQWTWHERYVALLWLSHLFFAPFDLSTISSGDDDDADRPVIPGFQWPDQIPGIALRVIPLGIKYLTSPGKERDGAKALLVRVAMRRDMQEIGILNSLVHWATHTLSSKDEGAPTTTYYYIGSLAFLARVLGASADTSIMDPYLATIYYATQSISSGDNVTYKVINDSAIARKTMIKVMRSVISLVLRKPRQAVEETEMVENFIGYLLESLADNDTPVRLAASKGLSIITLKLDPEMASQVVEAVLDSLNRNVLMVKSRSGVSGLPSRDVTAVDPLEWHGLMLTLAHLLYRRSPPPENLADIIHALLMGLAFEKRGTAGGSIGTNVRDAACFGIWALARRYTTAELLQVPEKSALVAEAYSSPSSILQVIAAELVVAGSLDPAGNIRRGSSAALQELIGRHPDTVEQGIAIVQTVDYHAVALRSRAIHEVALQSTRLSSQYGHALLGALLGWRGVADMDEMARRVAAMSFGTLMAEIANGPSSNSRDRFTDSVDLLLQRIRSLQMRQVEERHGLILSLAAVFDFVPTLLKKDSSNSLRLPVSRLVEALMEILQDCHRISYRKPELIAEAGSLLVVSSFPILLMYMGLEPPVSVDAKEPLKLGSIVAAEGNSAMLLASLATIDDAEPNRPSSLDDALNVLDQIINKWLDRNEVEVMGASSQASLILLLFCRPKERVRIIQSWATKIRLVTSTRKKHGNGYFHALTRAYHIVATLAKTSVDDDPTKALADRWKADEDIDTRVAILQSLTGRHVFRDRASNYISIVAEGLDDYTTNARGDVGSFVRLEAIKATKTLWEVFTLGGDAENHILGTVPVLYPRILRLAAEKLDRVRVEAQSSLNLILQPSHAEKFTTLSFSCNEYFTTLFRFCKADWFLEKLSAGWEVSEAECMSSLLAGLATSADTGNEELVIASRAAVAEFCEASSDHVSQVFMALIHNLKMYQGRDRVIVPTLELLAYLFHVGMPQRFKGINLRQICLLAQKACYKTGNVRKIEACIKVYGGVASVDDLDDDDNDGVGAKMTSELKLKRQEGIAEARRRLGALLIHPWPKVRALVVDELWGLMLLKADDGDGGVQYIKLMSVDWGKAEKISIKSIVEELGLN